MPTAKWRRPLSQSTWWTRGSTTARNQHHTATPNTLGRTGDRTPQRHRPAKTETWYRLECGLFVGPPPVWHGGCAECPTCILVIDDDPAIRNVVSDALRQDGYHVSAVANGQQALAALGKHLPDPLVLDLGMPVMDGPTLVRTLRERTKWGAVPLVVVSGSVGATESAPLLGARACLTKPFELSELVQSFERVAPPN